MAAVSTPVLSKHPGRVSLWAPVAAYMTAIFFMSSLSDPHIPTGTDKPFHGFGYLGLAIVVVRAVAGGLPRRVGLRTAVAAMAITVGYAISDEVHQMFVAGRSAELYDLLADAVGALGGTAICWAWGSRGGDVRHTAP